MLDSATSGCRCCCHAPAVPQGWHDSAAGLWGLDRAPDVSLGWGEFWMSSALRHTG